MFEIQWTITIVSGPDLLACVIKGSGVLNDFPILNV